MNYIEVELDTTPPSIQIIAPNYVAKDDTFTLFVNSNEVVDSSYDVYYTDDSDIKTQVNMAHEGDKLVGDISLTSASSSITIYAKVRDEVWNETDYVTKRVNIITGNKLKISNGAIMRTKKSSNEVSKIKAIKVTSHVAISTEKIMGVKSKAVNR